MTPPPILVVGDALLDVDLTGRAERLCPDSAAPVVDEVSEHARPGGAGLAALLAAQDGRDVILVTGIGDDDAGQRLRELLAPSVRLVELPFRGETVQKIRVRVEDQSVVRIDRGDGGAVTGERLPGSARRAIRSAGAVLVSDYGRGVSNHPEVRGELRAMAGRVPVVWDPHARGGPPVPGARLVTPNEQEAERFVPDLPRNSRDGLTAVADRAATLVREWSAGAVAVTLGPRGALLSFGSDSPVIAPAPAVPSSDTCGAGDRFASAAAGLLADGALTSEAVFAAVERAAAFVADGGAAAVTDDAQHLALPYERSDASETVARVRARGGTVVATGGCFDLLHAGHISTLQAARELGDCLVVLLNSDVSVRRLKGPDRPLVPQQDRTRVLEALACVDAVAVFNEDTPVRVLTELRPDLWVKGGDYANVSLPEAPLLARWGGQVVIAPYLAGRSTTGIVAAAMAAAGAR